ncbi:HD domain-containing protein [Rhodanobacter sp. 115]|uniref:HD domain-containing protein n=1 Tax=Rhodanobacter sp. FW021-MT20 TaxID=1162282 RepID=UPI0002610440|nr:HD domain-containing protein [Rhodanobacter sp. 115]EIL96754.1 metal dependent phosphohydrolase [Rhodanobacter sp. 115]
MNDLYTAEIAAHQDAYRYRREGVLIWDIPPNKERPPYHASFVTQDGVYPLVSWVDPPLFSDPDVVDKVSAVILSLPNHQMYLVHAERDVTLDPIEVMDTHQCPIPSVVVDTYDLLQSITTPALRRFVSDVFSLVPVFHGFWTSTAGTKHHTWPGGLAWHSLAVANKVAGVMTSPAQKQVNFRGVEYELGVIAALLHDVGKTVSYTQSGYCNERALMIGHELLGVELIRKPLETLRTSRSDLADAMTVLLLSRTRFACGPHRLEAIREVISKADRESAKRNTKPR